MLPVLLCLCSQWTSLLHDLGGVSYGLVASFLTIAVSHSYRSSCSLFWRAVMSWIYWFQFYTTWTMHERISVRLRFPPLSSLISSPLFLITLKLAVHCWHFGWFRGIGQKFNSRWPCQLYKSRLLDGLLSKEWGWIWSAEQCLQPFGWEFWLPAHFAIIIWSPAGGDLSICAVWWLAGAMISFIQPTGWMKEI